MCEAFSVLHTNVFAQSKSNWSAKGHIHIFKMYWIKNGVQLSQVSRQVVCVGRCSPNKCWSNKYNERHIRNFKFSSGYI